MKSLDEFASRKLAQLEEQGLRRVLVETDRHDSVRVARNGRELVSFCCNDYLGLTHHPDLKKAARKAIERYGVGAGASRLITGNHPLFRELELRLAALKGTEDAVVFGSGYLANLGIVPALVGKGDLIVADELCHACLLAGSRLSGADEVRFPHNDVEAVASLLRGQRAGYRRCLVLTDGVFSMDGDLAPVPALARLAAENDAWLMTDDAHGVGVVGNGRGSSYAFGGRVDVPLQMGTLSKAIGSYGGYLCTSKKVADLIRTRARTLIYATGLPPASAAAAIAAIDLIRSDRDLTGAPVAKAAAFCNGVGLPDPVSPIVPLHLGTADRAMAASALLEAEGFLVTAIRPPTVPDGTARLRFTFTATHHEEDVARLAAVVRGKLGVEAGAAQ